MSGSAGGAWARAAAVALVAVILDQMAKAAVVGMNYTRNQGQSCGSTSRLFVHADIADAVVERVRMPMPGTITPVKRSSTASRPWRSLLRAALSAA